MPKLLREHYINLVDYAQVFYLIQSIVLLGYRKYWGITLNVRNFYRLGNVESRKELK